MSYRRQNSDFTRDRKRNASDQILEDLKFKKKEENLNLKIEFSVWYWQDGCSDSPPQSCRGQRGAPPPCHPARGQRSDILVIFSRHTWKQKTCFLSTSKIDVRGFSQTFSVLREAWAGDQREIQSESERHRKSPVSLGCVTDGLRRLTLVEYSLGHPMLTSMAATSFSLDEQQHTVFSPPKKTTNASTQITPMNTHTHRVVDSHQLGYGQRPVRISGSLDKKKTRTTKNSQPSSSLCDWPPEVQQVSSVSPSGRQLGPSPAHRSWTWRDHRERQNPPCPTHLTQMQHNTVWVKRCSESASHSESPAGEGHPPFTTRRHWAILMSISSWNRQDQSAPRDGTANLTTTKQVTHLAVNHIRPVVQCQQPHGQRPDPDHRGQGGDVPEAQPARRHRLSEPDPPEAGQHQHPGTFTPQTRWLLETQLTV